MSDLRDLYQEVILDHNKTPRNFGPLEGADREADGYNPLCGDQVTVRLKLDGDRVAEVRFEGAGCAISTASASLMTEAVRGKSVAEAEAIFEKFHRMVAGADEPSMDEILELDKLAVFSGVREYPMRVKCATLAWHTLHAAVEGEDEPVTTE